MRTWSQTCVHWDSNLSPTAQVFCVHSEPNYSLPWQRKRQFSSTGSGFIIRGRRILTNAHCVDHHSQVKVRRRGSDTKVRPVARVARHKHMPWTWSGSNPTDAAFKIPCSALAALEGYSHPRLLVAPPEAV